MESQILIKSEQGHYAGYVNGKFYCTGDTYYEVERELDEILRSKGE